MIKNYVVLMLAMSCIIGCNDDATESLQSKKNENILTIKSPEEYLAITKKMLNASSAEVAHFEKENGFTSYRSVLLKAHAELMNIDSKEELSLFVAKYQNIFAWKNDQVMPLIELPLYQCLANESGFFETHGYLHKVTADYVYTVEMEDRHLLDDVNFEEDIKNEKVSVNNYTLSEQADRSSARYSDGTCPANYSQRGIYNPSGCSSDRDLSISVKTYQVCGFLHNGTPLCGQMIYIRGIPMRKNWYCEWWNYRSPVTFQNISYKIDGIEQVFTIPDAYIDDNISLYETSGLAFYFEAPVWSPVPGFNQVHVEATSQGLHGIWITMDQSCD